MLASNVAHAQLEPDQRVGERGAARVVQVQRELARPACARAARSTIVAVWPRRADADRVAEARAGSSRCPRSLPAISTTCATVDRRPRRGSPRRSTGSRARACPACARRARRPPRTLASVSAIVLLMFFLVCVSLAERKTAISFRPAACAPLQALAGWAPARENVTPCGCADQLRSSSSASASCGIHFGRDEARHLDALHPRRDERLDEPRLVLASGPCAARSAGRRAGRPRRRRRAGEALPSQPGAGWMCCRIHWTMSCVELPGVKISVTPRSLSLGMSSSGMMPPPKTRMSLGASASSAGR